MVDVISMIARDFETQSDADVDNNYEVSIIVTDNDGNIDTQTQIVTNVFEDSVSISAQIRSIEENSANGTSVGVALVTIGNPTSFSIVSGNTNTVFAINNSGQISVVDASKLDFEDTESYTLTVRITKTNTTPQTASIAVNVIDVFEVETIIFNSITYKTVLSF